MAYKFHNTNTVLDLSVVLEPWLWIPLYYYYETGLLPTSNVNLLFYFSQNLHLKQSFCAVYTHQNNMSQVKSNQPTGRPFLWIFHLYRRAPVLLTRNNINMKIVLRDRNSWFPHTQQRKQKKEPFKVITNKW